MTERERGRKKKKKCLQGSHTDGYVNSNFVIGKTQRVSESQGPAEEMAGSV